MVSEEKLGKMPFFDQTVSLPEPKGPVKRTVGENSSFIFTGCAKSVPRYNFKLAYVVLQMPVNEFFETTSKNGEIGLFNRALLIQSF